MSVGKTIFMVISENVRLPKILKINNTEHKFPTIDIQAQLSIINGMQEMEYLPEQNKPENIYYNGEFSRRKNLSLESQNENDKMLFTVFIIK